MRRTQLYRPPRGEAACDGGLVREPGSSGRLSRKLVEDRLGGCVTVTRPGITMRRGSRARRRRWDGSARATGDAAWLSIGRSPRVPDGRRRAGDHAAAAQQAGSCGARAAAVAEGAEPHSIDNQFILHRRRDCPVPASLMHRSKSRGQGAECRRHHHRHRLSALSARGQRRPPPSGGVRQGGDSQASGAVTVGRGAIR